VGLVGCEKQAVDFQHGTRMVQGLNQAMMTTTPSKGLSHFKWFYVIIMTLYSITV
jgi:hypothetical protein